jgi:hypothetical protein
MGNSVWRLTNVLNLTARNAARAGWSDRLEIVVVDFGSVEPLACMLRLSEEASRMCRFIHVTADQAKAISGDSPFPEVRALNIGIRRCKGSLIGRIDNDTIVGHDFFTQLQLVLEQRLEVRADLRRTMFFVRRRCLPFGFSSKNRSYAQVDVATTWLGGLHLIEKLHPFFKSAVGIVMLSSDLWAAVRGYDERLIYWGWMEVDLAYRVQLDITRHVLDLGDLMGVPFYHLEHYDPQRPRATSRRANDEIIPRTDIVNDERWGFADAQFVEARATPDATVAKSLKVGPLRKALVLPPVLFTSGALKNAMKPVYRRCVGPGIRYRIGKWRGVVK